VGASFVPKSTLEARAEDVRRAAIDAGVPAEFPFDVESTVEFLLEFDLNLGADLPKGILGLTNFDRRLVSVSGSITNDGRRRFTVAHEIGHIVLHRSILEAGLVQPSMFISESAAAAQDDSMEWQANFFAAALLMPREAVAARFGRDARAGRLVAPERVADAFGVSREAATIRLQELDFHKREAGGGRRLF